MPLIHVKCINSVSASGQRSCRRDVVPVPYGKFRPSLEKHTKLFKSKAKMTGQRHFPFYQGTKKEKQRDVRISLQAGTEKGI